MILNWNGEDDSIECLKSIRASASAGFVPVLVDNGSQAASLDALKKACSSIYSRICSLKRTDLSAPNPPRLTEITDHLDDDSLVVIENDENLGFAKGNNIGIRLASLIGAKWVMLLNNDTVVSPNAFQELRKFVEGNPLVNAVTPQIRYYQPSTRIQNCGGLLTYFGGRKYILANVDADRAPDITSSPITFVTGCALLFKHGVTGPLTEDFFFGEEDYEFSLRMKKRGFGMACAYKAVIYHKVGTSITKASTAFGTILVHYACRLMNTRNYYSSIRWHSTRLLAYLYLPVVLVKNGISLRKTLFAARSIDFYIRNHATMGFTEFQAMIRIQSAR